jgi:hypothetical protein
LNEPDEPAGHQVQVMTVQRPSRQRVALWIFGVVQLYQTEQCLAEKLATSRKTEKSAVGIQSDQTEQCVSNCRLSFCERGSSAVSIQLKFSRITAVVL